MTTVLRKENTPPRCGWLAVAALTELSVSGPMPLVFYVPAFPDQAQQASGVVRILVRNRWRLVVVPPLRLVLVTTTQALPGQLALMCSGASWARSSQTVPRLPWN
jgi:hypothetical protein